MKKLVIACLAFASLNVFAETPRDLEANPLNEMEEKALEVAAAMADGLGEEIVPECTNVSDPGSNPVLLQFYSQDEEGEDSCGDFHYSIGVEFDGEGRAINIQLNDA
jgi:hypothetical protein